MTAALSGDPKRQAGASIRGYEYQFLRTAESWLQLRQDQKLYVECGEDFDVISPGGAAQATQVKSAGGTITLNSPTVHAAIANFWELRERNHGRDICMRFLTRESIGLESRVGLKGQAGLKLWAHAARGNVAAARLVAKHLSKAGAGQVLGALVDEEPQALILQLFSKIEWVCGEPSLEAVRMNVERLAIQVGEELGLGPVEAAGAVPALLDRCRAAAMAQEIELRSLTRDDARHCMEHSTTLGFVHRAGLRDRLGGRDYLRAFLEKHLALLQRVEAAGAQLAVEIDAGDYDLLGSYVASMRLAERLCFDTEVSAGLASLNDVVASVWLCISDDNYIPSGSRWKFDNMWREGRNVQTELAAKKLEMAEHLDALSQRLETLEELARRSPGDLLKRAAQ